MVGGVVSTTVTVCRPASGSVRVNCSWPFLSGLKGASGGKLAAGAPGSAKCSVSWKSAAPLPAAVWAVTVIVNDCVALRGGLALSVTRTVTV